MGYIQPYPRERTCAYAERLARVWLDKVATVPYTHGGMEDKREACVQEPEEDSSSMIQIKATKSEVNHILDFILIVTLATLLTLNDKSSCLPDRLHISVVIKLS